MAIKIQAGNFLLKCFYLFFYLQHISRLKDIRNIANSTQNVRLIFSVSQIHILYINIQLENAESRSFSLANQIFTLLNEVKMFMQRLRPVTSIRLFGNFTKCAVALDNLLPAYFIIQKSRGCNGFF